MQAGRLRHRITIQRKTEARDSYGDAVPTWSDVAEVWAEILSVTGREEYLSEQHRETGQWRIRIRKRDGMNGTMRVLHGDEVYDVLAVLPDQWKTREQILVCKTGASNG